MSNANLAYSNPPAANTQLDDQVALRHYTTGKRSSFQLLAKRSVDVTVSLGLLLCITPFLLPLLSLLIALESKGGIFFIQKRIGKRNAPFMCFKFRTMLPSERFPHLSDFERITKLGLFLRTTHLDELPQLVNVLRGDMSLVGPRPHMLSDTQDFQQRAKNYHLRHSVRPGITGLAQVHGYYGSVTDNDHLHRRVAYDIEYVYTWNLRKDLSILLRTIMIPLKDGK